MKGLKLFLASLAFVFPGYSQENGFPESWEGNWKGDLMIYSSAVTDQKAAQIVPMQLDIQPINENRWSWVITYDLDNENVRNYELVRDTSTNQWAIDENNGILLKQALIGNRLASCFSVMGNLLICYYWVENDALNMEIHITKMEAESSTGLGTEESPEVSNHFIGTFQKAVLFRK